MKLTEHCKKRNQQRGIHPDTIYLIREHGRKINKKSIKIIGN